MKKDISITRIIVVLLFAITFTVVGVGTPIMYAAYAPHDNIIEEHNFVASNATLDSESHYICFDRTVQHPATGKVFNELYMMGDNGERIEVASEREYRYFQGGETKVVTEVSLPANLDAGEYRYLLIVELNLADGLVERAFTFESKTFTISNETESESREEMAASC